MIKSALHVHVSPSQGQSENPCKNEHLIMIVLAKTRISTCWFIWDIQIVDIRFKTSCSACWLLFMNLTQTVADGSEIGFQQMGFFFHCPHRLLPARHAQKELIM